MTAPPPLMAWHSRRQLRRTGCGDRSSSEASRAGPEPSEPAVQRPDACARPRCRFAAARSPARPTRMPCRRSHRAVPGHWARCSWPARRPLRARGAFRVRGASRARQPVPALRASSARPFVPALRASCARQPSPVRPAFEFHWPSQARGRWLLRPTPALATAPLRSAPVQDRRAVSPPRPPRPGVPLQPSRRRPAKARHLPVHEAEQALPARRRVSPAPGAARSRGEPRSSVRRAAPAATLPSGSPARLAAVTHRTLQRRAAGLASPSGRDTRARRRHATPQAPAATRRSMHPRPAAPESPARVDPSYPRRARAPEASHPGPKPVPRAQGGRSTARSRPLPRRPGAAACGRNAGSTGRCPG
jgi:hypothetical protein